MLFMSNINKRIRFVKTFTPILSLSCQQRHRSPNNMQWRAEGRISVPLVQMEKRPVDWSVGAISYFTHQLRAKNITWIFLVLKALHSIQFRFHTKYKYANSRVSSESYIPIKSYFFQTFPIKSYKLNKFLYFPIFLFS